MKPVTQTRIGNDGNCLAACMASILEIPLYQVPEFTEDGWLEELNDFLANHNLQYKRRPVEGTRPVGWSTIERISPRGGLHACVARDGKLVHDPHPQDGTGRGLVEPYYYGVLEPTTVRARDAVSKETLEKKLAVAKKRYEDQIGRASCRERVYVLV